MMTLDGEERRISALHHKNTRVPSLYGADQRECALYMHEFRKQKTREAITNAVDKIMQHDIALTKTNIATISGLHPNTVRRHWNVAQKVIDKNYN
jgi:hypothetical protein